MMDLTGLFRVWNPQYKSYSVFGQVRAGLGPRLRRWLGHKHAWPCWQMKAQTLAQLQGASSAKI